MNFDINNLQTDRLSEDLLIVSFDYNLDNDIATIMVARKYGDNIKILNSLTGDEAIDLYYKLTNGE